MYLFIWSVSRYCTFVACLKPVLGEEVSLVSELQQLEEVGTGHGRMYCLQNKIFTLIFLEHFSHHGTPMLRPVRVIFIKVIFFYIALSFLVWIHKMSNLVYL